MITGKLSQKCGLFRHENPALVIYNIRVRDLSGYIFPEPLDGLVDTGADQSAIPQVIRTRLGLSITGFKNVRGFDNMEKTWPVCRVYFIVEGVGKIPLNVFVTSRSYILLGRDFLRKMLLVMDNKISQYALLF